MIITIGRECGSGGHVIGQMIADIEKIPYYDKQILVRAAQESGFSPQVLEQHDEKRHISSFMGGGSPRGNVMGSSFVPLNQQMYLAQVAAINRIAEEGSCVIVGRSADYILRERKDLFRVFFYGCESCRVSRIMDTEHCDENHARELIRKKDKERKSYYNFFADGDWGSRGKYDAMICTDFIPMAEIAKAVLLLAKNKIAVSK